MTEGTPPPPGNVYGHSRAHLAELRARFPTQFRDDLVCDWPDGWHPIVESVCAFAAVHAPDVKWRDIKEKLGGLRMYFHITLSRAGTLTGYEAGRPTPPLFPELREEIRRAEDRSYVTCCLCSQEVSLERTSIRKPSGGMKPSCPECESRILRYWAEQAADHTARIDRGSQDR